MKTLRYFSICCFVAAFCGSGALFAQNVLDRASIAPGAADVLLPEKPVMVSPVRVDSANGWLTMETDVQVITETPLDKIYAVMHDIPGQVAVFTGKKSKTKQARVVDQQGDTATVDCITTTFVGPFQIDTPYRAQVVEKEASADQFIIEVTQTDSGDNNKIRDLYAIRFACRLTGKDGKNYTYVRFYGTEKIPSSIVPRKILASGSEGVNVEVLNLLLAAAKKN
jgi:hypothetical protein